MSNYFILTKTIKDEVNHNNNNEIITFNTEKYTFILPYNNLTYHIQNGLFESNLIQWSKQFCSKDKIMLDIGAHTGTYSINLSTYCKEIYAFEPQKMTYYALCGSIALSNIKNVNCINKGLGSIQQCGKQQLHIISLDGGGSTLKLTDNMNEIDSEDIEVITLDSMNIKDIGFIKIDVEGNELNVLKSGIETLKNSNYPKILFEMNETDHELMKFLYSLKYKVIKINGYNNMFLAEQ